MSYATGRMKREGITDAPRGAPKVCHSEYVCCEGECVKTHVSAEMQTSASNAS